MILSRADLHNYQKYSVDFIINHPAWDSRTEAKDYFLDGIFASEGSERERYAFIYAKLILGYDYCTDEAD